MIHIIFKMKTPEVQVVNPMIILLGHQLRVSGTVVAPLQDCTQRQSFLK
jgi:hypothetical protein